MCVCVCVYLQIESMESHLRELEQSKKELTDHKYRSEAAIRELKAKLKTTEEVRDKITNSPTTVCTYTVTC